MKVNASATESIRKVASELLSDGSVAAVIGYGSRSVGEGSAAVFIRKSEDAGRLSFDDSCFNNLAVYLSRKEISDLGKLAVVLKGCDLRAVNVLFREKVIKRDGLFLIGVRCDGVGDPKLGKCLTCEVRDPKGCDLVVGDPVPPAEKSAEKYNDVLELESKSLEERWEYWRKQFDKCVRCYACRQACPLCYCKQCVVEKSVPQWVETSPHLRGNLAWNTVRAFHLTGRCVGCGECERVCPMGIELGVINKKMTKLVEEWFEFTSGMDPEEKGPFSVWSSDDSEEGIL